MSVLPYSRAWFVAGASRGLGLELVTRLLRRGATVAAMARAADRLLSALGGDVRTSVLLPPTATCVTGRTAPGRRRDGRGLGIQTPWSAKRATPFWAPSRRPASSRSPLRLLLGPDEHAYAAAEVEALPANLGTTAQSAPKSVHSAA